MEKPRTEWEKLKTLQLDVEKKILKINGKDFPISNTTSLSISVDAGIISLITEQEFSSQLKNVEE